MPMPMLGSRNSTPAARKGPDFSPKPARSRASHTGFAITAMKNIHAATASTMLLSSTARRMAIGPAAADVVADAQGDEEQRDEAAPDEDRVAEIGGEDAAADDLQAHQHGAGDEDEQLEARLRRQQRGGRGGQGERRLRLGRRGSTGGRGLGFCLAAMSESCFWCVTMALPDPSEYARR